MSKQWVPAGCSCRIEILLYSGPCLALVAFSHAKPWGVTALARREIHQQLSLKGCVSQVGSSKMSRLVTERLLLVGQTRAICYGQHWVLQDFLLVIKSRPRFAVGCVGFLLCVHSEPSNLGEKAEV